MLKNVGELTTPSSQIVAAARVGQADRAGMISIPGGTFRMGSDNHYPEEAPVHRVTVDAFWIDHTPVTNRQFKEFVRATGHVTFAEIPPDPKDYPGALPHMLYAGSLVFMPPGAASRSARLERMVALHQGRRLAPPLWTQEQHRRARQPSGRARDLRRRAGLRAMGGQGPADRGRMGIRRARRSRGCGVRLGRRVHARRPAHGQYLAGRISRTKPARRRLRRAPRR